MRLYDIFRSLGNIQYQFSEKPGEELYLFETVEGQPFVDEIRLRRLKLPFTPEDGVFRWEFQEEAQADLLVAYVVQLEQEVIEYDKSSDLNAAAQFFVQFPRQCLHCVLAILHTSAGHEAEVMLDVVFD